MGEAFCECGRPLKFQSVEELVVQINSYFADCDTELEQTVTVTKDGAAALAAELIATEDEA